MDEFDRRLSNEMKQRVQGISLTEQEKERVKREINRLPAERKKRNYIIWTVAAAAATLFLLLALPLLQQFKSEQDSGAPLPDDFYDGMEKLDLRVLYEKKLEDGRTEYMVEVDNGTERLIREGTLFLSFDIQIENGIAGNSFKQSWRLGEDLKPGQKMEVSMITETSVFDQEQIDFNYITLELIGYLDDLEPRNIFHVGQSNSNVEGIGERQWKKF